MTKVNKAKVNKLYSWLSTTGKSIIIFILGVGAGLIVERIFHPFQTLERTTIGYEKSHGEKMGFVPYYDSMTPVKKGAIGIYRPKFKELNDLIYDNNPASKEISKEIEWIFSHQIEIPDLRIRYYESRDREGSAMHTGEFRQGGLAIQIKHSFKDFTYIGVALDNGQKQHDIYVYIDKSPDKELYEICVNKKSEGGYESKDTLSKKDADKFESLAIFLLNQASEMLGIKVPRLK